MTLVEFLRARIRKLLEPAPGGRYDLDGIMFGVAVVLAAAAAALFVVWVVHP